MTTYSKEFKEEATRLSDEIGKRKRQSSSESRITRWQIGETAASINRRKRLS